MNKQELINFITEHLQPDEWLQTNEELLGTTAQSGLVLGESINKTWCASKERVLTVIQEYFDENLKGHMPNDESHIVRIISWSVVKRDF